MRIPLLVAALVGSLAFATQATAAPKPQIPDPAGDAIGLGAGYDVVSALFSTEGTTTRVGRRTLYTPTKLKVTVTYAGAVPTDAYAAQVVRFDIGNCSSVYLESYDGGTYGSAACLADAFDFAVMKTGKTMTFTLPFSVVGKAFLKKGAVLTGLRTYTAVADPVLGYESQEVGFDVAGAVDSATTATPYKIA